MSCRGLSVRWSIVLSFLQTIQWRLGLRLRLTCVLETSISPTSSSRHVMEGGDTCGHECLAWWARQRAGLLDRVHGAFYRTGGTGTGRGGWLSGKKGRVYCMCVRFRGAAERDSGYRGESRSRVVKVRWDRDRDRRAGVSCSSDLQGTGCCLNIEMVKREESSSVWAMFCIGI